MEKARGGPVEQRTAQLGKACASSNRFALYRLAVLVHTLNAMCALTSIFADWYWSYSASLALTCVCGIQTSVFEGEI